MPRLSIIPHRWFARLEMTRAARVAVTLALTLLASATAQAQASRSASAAPVSPPTASANQLASATDLQGIWDFSMRAGDRTSPGFLALGPVDGGWAGSITMCLTNTLAIRQFTVVGDSVRMVVASREGDVRFLGRLLDGGSAMEGIVEYHGGALLPMRVTRRVLPVAPR